MTSSDQVVPELVPARMVNEFAYCPRLFFLEWVQARFTHNDDTAEGVYAHRAVDRPQGAAPPPGGEGEIRRARSLELSSERLGLAAKVDVVEGEDGEVVPVETKKGSPPDIPEGAWEPERVQVCIQGLLLREAGYACRKGYLYFADARQRVEVPLSDALIERTLAIAEELRAVASCDSAPPPLVGSRKCPRCSLVGICLPDETNALAARSDLPPRHLVPRDPASRPLYVTEQGVTVGVRSGRVEVGRRAEPSLASVRLIDVSQTCVFGNVQVSSQAMRELFAREVPVLWFSYGGWLQGMATGLPAKHVELRRQQVVCASAGGLEIARRIVEGKVRNSRTLLRRNARLPSDRVVATLKNLAADALAAPNVATLLGIEGAAARLYFSEFASMIRPELSLPGEAFSFEGRGRRPPPDPVNCLLSFVYALLVKDLLAATWAVGFDPYLGVYHRPRFGRPALALDLAEELRPLIAESVVINVINNGEVQPSDFTVRAGGVGLTAHGRRKVIAAYERRLDVEIHHPTFGYQITYRRVLDVQARILAAYMLGEVPNYVPLLTR